jgi:hypothetical protein
MELDMDLGAVRESMDARRRLPDAALADELVTELHEARYSNTWGSWLGREEVFYERCAALVEGMTWDDVRALGGQEIRALESIAKASQSGMSASSLPSTLRVVPRAGTVAGGVVEVITYSPYDPAMVPEAVWAALSLFDGNRSTPDVLAMMPPAATGFFDDERALPYLLDYGLLGASVPTVAAAQAH